MMLTSWTIGICRVSRATSAARYSFLSRRKSAAAFSASCVRTRASTIGGEIGLVM
jgi:hypothetical protein